MKPKYDIKQLAVVPPPYGGVSIYIKRLIENLTRDGFKVGGYYLPECRDRTLRESTMFDQWSWMQTKLFPFKIWKFLHETSQYKIVHSHFGLEGMAYLLALQVLGRKKIIVTVHNSMIDSYVNHTNLINRYFLNKMLKSPNVTWIAVSEEGKQKLCSLPIIPRTPVSVIPAYIPVDNAAYPPLPETMDEYMLLHDKNIVFYGHSFMVHDGIDVYGFETAIKAYAEVSSATSAAVGMIFCLADNSENGKITGLHKYARQLNVDDKIYWQIGALDDIHTLWHKADVYIRPTSTDGDSVAVREALDEGMTVIASDVCKRPEGVLTYPYDDNSKLSELICLNLNESRKKSTPSMMHYTKMKNIYANILKNDQP